MKYDFYVLDGNSRYEVKVVDDEYLLRNINTGFSTTYPVNDDPDNFMNTTERFYEKVSPTFPDTLSFYHAGTTQQYNLQRIGNHSVVPLWACSEDGDKFRGATYTAEEIAHHFAEGHWKEFSFAEEATKERELVFPFTVEHTDSSKSVYVITDGPKEGFVTCDAHKDYSYANIWSHDDCRRFITEGLWRVISVGPQKPIDPPTSASSILGSPTRPAPPMPAVKPYKGIEITKETVGQVSSLSIKIDSDDLVEATERAEALAQAVENVNIALESFQAIIKDFNVNVEISHD
jgi:hypothetical protein